MTSFLRGLRRVLDFIYLAAGILAALCLIAILMLIVAQMVARWTGEMFPGVPAYVAYCMASASFFAFAHALNRGAHIRVSILLNAVSPGIRRWLEAWCFAIGTALAWYFVYYAWRFISFSYKFGDISQEQDKTLLWIPQMSLMIGGVILAIALTDHLIHVVFTGRHRIEMDSVGQRE